MTRQIRVGGVPLGGGAAVSIQSMCNTVTSDVSATVAQIHRLEEAGCQIALYGHTHCPDVETRRTMMVNPGAACNGQLALLEVEDGRPRVSLLSY